MKYVDPIIRYLSGEMKPEEVLEFENRIASDTGLRNELEEAAAAYHLIRKQLRKMDEDAFRAKLRDVMEETGPANRSGPLRRRIRNLLIPAAAAAAVIAAVLLVLPRRNHLFSKYYHPGEDPVLVAYAQGTRGRLETGIALFQSGRYADARKHLVPPAAAEPPNYLARTYLVLCMIELDSIPGGLPDLDPAETDNGNPLVRSQAWYTALALVKAERREEALKVLEPLSESPGPYRKEARQLKKKLLK